MDSTTPQSLSANSSTEDKQLLNSSSSCLDEGEDMITADSIPPSSPCDTDSNSASRKLDFSSSSFTRMSAAIGSPQRSSARRPTRLCHSPISSIVGSAMKQLNLKRSSSAPMINQLGTGKEPLGTSPLSTSPLTSEISNDITKGELGEASTLANSFLATFDGPRPRRFSASFSPGSPGPVSSRVHKLRLEDSKNWEANSEKEYNGTATMAQSWEDLSLDSMSMEANQRRSSLSEQLWLAMPPVSSASGSASSSPAASPRVFSRFSPSLSSPSPTRRSFTSRRSLSPIAVRPSVLSVGLGNQGLKRKCDWDSNQMDYSHPAKRFPGLLSFNNNNGGSGHNIITSASSNSPINCPSILPSGSSHLLCSNNNPSSASFQQQNSSSSSSSISMVPNFAEDSPNSIDTDRESSVSSVCGGDSPFFRPVDSPVGTTATSSDESARPLSKIVQ